MENDPVYWWPATWQADLEEHEVDITRVVTEVMARPGWTSGNPVAVQVHPSGGTGQRSAYSVDGNAAHAARLQVTYTREAQLTIYVYDEANRLIEVDGTPYTWDDNGNLVNDGAKSYTIPQKARGTCGNQANRLTDLTQGATTLQFDYNGDGARLRQVIAGVPTTYTQDLAAPLPVVLQSKTGANAMKYVYALGTRPLAQHGSTWEYLLADALGSVRQIVDVNGNVTFAESYEPYGSVLSSNGTASSIFGYSGEEAEQSDEWPRWK